MQPSTIVVDESKPPLTTVGNRTIATHGYSLDALELHLREHAKKQAEKELWCDVSCVTRVFYGRSTDASRRHMRKKLGAASKELLGRGLLLLRQYGGRYGSIEKVKLFDRDRVEDQDYAIKQRLAMEERGEATLETLTLIDQVIGISPGPEGKNVD
jgi:hypothetical protein